MLSPDKEGGFWTIGGDCEEGVVVRVLWVGWFSFWGEDWFSLEMMRAEVRDH
jgi:hypothetical protein